MSAKWSLLCFRSLLGLVIGQQSEYTGLPIAMSREAHNFILTSPTGSLLLDEGYFGPMF